MSEVSSSAAWVQVSPLNQWQPLGVVVAPEAFLTTAKPAIMLFVHWGRAQALRCNSRLRKKLLGQAGLVALLRDFKGSRVSGGNAGAAAV